MWSESVSHHLSLRIHERNVKLQPVDGLCMPRHPSVRSQLCSLTWSKVAVKLCLCVTLLFVIYGQIRSKSNSQHCSLSCYSVLLCVEHSLACHVLHWQLNMFYSIKPRAPLPGWCLLTARCYWHSERQMKNRTEQQGLSCIISAR